MSSQKLIEVARQFVGVREQGGPNRGPLVEEFQKAVDGVAAGEPWCMAFVQYCVQKVEAATGKPAHIFRSEHCQTVWRQTKADFRFHEPLPGDIVIWRMGLSFNGHTGIVCKVVGSSIFTIEGNTGAGLGVVREGDGVYERVRSLHGDGSMKVLGFIRPWRT